MKEVLSRSIARYRKEAGLTQDDLAQRLNISFQAVSKWETAQSLPDIALLPELARELRVSIDQLLGYMAYRGQSSYYEDAYRQEAFFWGVQPSRMCLKILELAPPLRPLKLLDIGCGEGKDAVFMARCGYEVSAFDISEAGLEKAAHLAQQAQVRLRLFKADLLDYRLHESYDVVFSSGVLHYIHPELRSEIITDYRQHTRPQGLHAFHVFVEKPFIAPPPEVEEGAFNWHSGELFMHYHDWLIESCDEIIFDCMSSGIPHQHAANRLIARRKVLVTEADCVDV